METLEQVIKWQAPIYIFLLNVFFWSYRKIKKTPEIVITGNTMSLLLVLSFIFLIPLLFIVSNGKEERDKEIKEEIISLIPGPNALPLEFVVAELSEKHAAATVYDVIQEMNQSKKIRINESVDCACDISAIGDRKQTIKLIWKNE